MIKFYNKTKTFNIVLDLSHNLLYMNFTLLQTFLPFHVPLLTIQVDAEQMLTEMQPYCVDLLS